MKNQIEPGQVYIGKSDRIRPEAVIIHRIDQEGNIYTRHTSCMNTHNQFRPVTTKGVTQEQFLEKHELATPEKLEGIIARLKEEEEVVSEKLSFLRQYLENFNS